MRDRAQREHRPRAPLPPVRQQLPDLLPRPSRRIGAVEIVHDQERRFPQVLEQGGVGHAVVLRIRAAQPVEQVRRDKVERLPPHVEPPVGHLRQQPHPRLVGCARQHHPALRRGLVRERACFGAAGEHLGVFRRDPPAVERPQVAQAAHPCPLRSRPPRCLAAALDRPPEIRVIQRPLDPHEPGPAAAPAAARGGHGRRPAIGRRRTAVRRPVAEHRAQPLHRRTSCS